MTLQNDVSIGITICCINVVFFPNTSLDQPSEVNELADDSESGIKAAISSVVSVWASLATSEPCISRQVMRLSFTPFAGKTPLRSGRSDRSFILTCGTRLDGSFRPSKKVEEREQIKLGTLKAMSVNIGTGCCGGFRETSTSNT